MSTIENGRIRHNSDAIATSIIQLICDDLKFRDMQNDTRYIMLDSKIKDTKKKMKKNKKKTNNKKSNSKHPVSKFFEKYNDRIQSIQESSKRKAPVNKKSEEKRTIGDGQALKNKMQETLKKMKAANKKK